MKNILKYITLLLVFITSKTIAQTSVTINKPESPNTDYIVTGTETLTATKSITLKSDTWIKQGSTFVAQISSDVYNSPVFSNENYIFTRTFQSPMTNVSGISNNKDVLESITYFDGLGRPMQNISIKASPEKQDIVTHIGYDGFGRQDKDYLPYMAATGSNASYRTGADLAANNYYMANYASDIDSAMPNPFSQKSFENSPLNRVLKQAAPGKDWKLGNGHEIKNDYQTNTIDDQVRLFGVSFIAGNSENPYLEDKGIYSPSQLYKTIVKDENWQANQNFPNDHTTEEFKDKEGNVVLKRTFDAGTWFDTYYVYDDYGNLTYVLPPKVYAYNSITQGYKNQSFNYYSDVDNFDFFTDGNNNYGEVTISINNSSSLSLYFYADGFINGSTLKSGKILDLDFSPALPNMSLGHIMMENSEGDIVSAGTAYIQDGDLYFSSNGSIVYPNIYDGYWEGYMYFNLADYQANYIPPALDRTTFDDLVYQYRYDNRNRLVEKKLPGKNWEYVIYDKLDRPVLTQDANLRANQKWLFTKYDAFGRVIYTGMYNHGISLNRADMQNYFDTNNNGASKMYESKVVSGTGYDNTFYTNNNFPNTSIEIYTINYYDDYDFNTNGGTPLIPVVSTKGLATGSKIRILGTANWITNVNGYDEKGRLIYTYNNNDYLGTTSTVNNELNFIGQVLKNTSIHTRNSVTTTIVDSFTYDQAGRATNQTQTINGVATPEVIAENVYDELGQLVQKKVGGKTTQNRLQTVDYTYNIRGWLKGINSSGTSNNTIVLGPGDLFGFQINYNNPSNGTGLYNGNISQTFWKSNYYYMNDYLKSYTYTYDALNRLKTGKYAQNNVLNSKYDETIDQYDRNGNILSLVRNMQNQYDNNWAAGIDNLTYTYDKGNRLMKVEDSYKNLPYGFEGFKDGNNIDDDYSYDANGNMVKDLNKGIGTSTSEGIAYNYLNLPVRISFNTGETIDYVYNALGEKQRKIISTGITTDYANGFQYESNVLKFFPHPEGYVECNSGNFSYVYQYKDHLGNVRLSYKDVSLTNVPSLQVLEENSYYPFGLKHKDSNVVVNSTNNPGLKFKYNSKELQDELGLNMYDYGARNYDPALGRWMNIDPLAEKGRRWSPYNYAMNNPVFFIDPDGMFPGPSWLRTFLFGVSHPEAGINIGQAVRGSNNISSNATRFATTGEVLVGSDGKGNDEGSQNGAFRHTLWQATITTRYGAGIAKQAGDAHEENPDRETGGAIVGNLADADERVDLSNNIIGRRIGEENPDLGMRDLALKVLETFRTDGLWTATKVKLGTSQEGEGYVVTRTQISDKQYKQLKELFSHLNNNGRTESQEKARAEFWKKQSERDDKNMKFPRG